MSTQEIAVGSRWVFRSTSPNVTYLNERPCVVTILTPASKWVCIVQFDADHSHIPAYASELHSPDHGIRDMSSDAKFLCGGDGRVTPEAQAELEAFGKHLRKHTGGVVAGCRFCAERAAKRNPLPPDHGTPERHSLEEVRAINQAAAHLDGVLDLVPEERRALAKRLFEIAGNPMPESAASRRALGGATGK